MECVVAIVQNDAFEITDQVVDTLVQNRTINYEIFELLVNYDERYRDILAPLLEKIDE